MKNDAVKDRRVIKTKIAIRKAFSELLSEKGFDYITIKEIADRADINRKTFYFYYSGIHELVDEVENEIVTAFEEDLQDFDLGRGLTNPDILFNKIKDIVEGDFAFYGRLLKRGNPTLVPKMVDALKRKMMDYLSVHDSVSPDAVETIADFMVSGISSAYQSWFVKDREIPIELLSRQVSSMVVGGLDAILSDNQK